MKERREIWIDHTKLIACILVAVGHFFQGIIGAGIVSQVVLYQWFIQTIYFFHVPLFFLCSGYLYQKYTKVNSFAAWKRHLMKKGLTLGIPYFTFSVAAWLLKEVFSGAVNNPNNGLLSTLLLEPSAPYWYLYVLFFIFAVTPVFSNVKSAVWGMFGALALKTVHLFVGETQIYILSKLMEFEIWFVLGMCLAMSGFTDQLRDRKWRTAGAGVLLAFLIGSVLIYKSGLSDRFFAFLEGILGCLSVVLLMINWNPQGKTGKLPRVLSGYSMPIFLMHTIFAAGLRGLLVKIGIMMPAVHIILGLTVSFVGPIAAAEIMKRMKLDVLLYPGKYIKLSKN